LRKSSGKPSEILCKDATGFVERIVPGLRIFATFSQSCRFTSRFSTYGFKNPVNLVQFAKILSRLPDLHQRRRGSVKNAAGFCLAAASRPFLVAAFRVWAPGNQQIPTAGLARQRWQSGGDPEPMSRRPARPRDEVVSLLILSGESSYTMASVWNTHDYKMVC